MSHIYRNTRAERQAQEAERLAKNPPKPKVVKETDISRKIGAWLEKKLGAISIRVNSGFVTDASGNRFHGAATGTSDRINCLPVATPLGVVGVFLAIEVKRPGNKPTPAQARFLEHVRNLGGIGFYAVSVDDAKQQLNAELKRRFGVSNEHE